MKEIAGGKVPTSEQLFKYPRDAGAGEELSSVLMKAIRENPEAVLEIADSVEPFSVDCVCSTPSPEVYPDPAFDTLDTAASELWVRIHKVQSIKKPELTKKRDRCLHQLAASLRETRIRFGALPAEVVLNANAPKAREVSTEQSNITAADASCLFSSSGPKHLKADNTPGLYVFWRVSILDQSVGKLKNTLPILVCERLEKSEKDSEIKVVQTYALPRLTEEANEAWYNADQSNPVRFIGWNTWNCFIIEYGQQQGMIIATSDGHFKINVWDIDRSPLAEAETTGRL